MHQSDLFVIRWHALVCEHWVVNAPTLLQRLLRVVCTISLHWVKRWREEVDDEFSSAWLFVDQWSHHLHIWLLLLLYLRILRQRTAEAWSLSIELCIATYLEQNLLIRCVVNLVCFRSTDHTFLAYWAKEHWHDCGEVTALTFLGLQERRIQFELDFLLALRQQLLFFRVVFLFHSNFLLVDSLGHFV